MGRGKSNKSLTRQINLLIADMGVSNTPDNRRHARMILKEAKSDIPSDVFKSDEQAVEIAKEEMFLRFKLHRPELAP